MALDDDPRWSRAAAFALQWYLKDDAADRFRAAVLSASSVNDLSEEHRAIIERADRELSD